MTGRLMNGIHQRLSAGLGGPQNNIYGWLLKGIFLKYHDHLELNAVKLSKIKPDYKVLEVGFGPGLGLAAAHNIIREGNGKVYGIDRSFYMVDTARKRLKRGVQDRKVVLFHGSAVNIPLNTDSIDRVYHNDCYYFWPNMRLVMREIYRVMKPGAVMVTTLSFDNLRNFKQREMLTDAQTDPVRYMTCLENYGFEGVRMDYMTDDASGRPFQVIYAEIGDKPAHHTDMLSDDEDEGEEVLAATGTDNDKIKPIMKPVP